MLVSPLGAAIVFLAGCSVPRSLNSQRWETRLVKLPEGCHRGLRNVHFLPAGMATRSPNSKFERLSKLGSLRQCFDQLFVAAPRSCLAAAGSPRENIGSEAVPQTVADLMRIPDGSSIVQHNRLFRLTLSKRNGVSGVGIGGKECVGATGRTV